MKKSRSIIITGDDFGSSRGVNRAIIEAHERGVLTNASLMVTGEAFEEAVALARAHPRLAVGLHLVLINGRSALSPQRIPHLVDPAGNFSTNPFNAGLRYQCRPAARREIRLEIRAQLEKFRATGLRLSHVDGHRHMHMPPVVLSELAELAEQFGIRAVRLPSEELRLGLQADKSRPVQKTGLWGVFSALRETYARDRLRPAGIRFPDRVYGLLQTGRMTEAYLLKLIPRIRADWVEVYSHPTADPVALSNGASRQQLEALLSDRVREALDSEGFRLATYHELR